MVGGGWRLRVAGPLAEEEPPPPLPEDDPEDDPPELPPPGPPSPRRITDPPQPRTASERQHASPMLLPTTGYSWPPEPASVNSAPGGTTPSLKPRSPRRSWRNCRPRSGGSRPVTSHRLPYPAGSSSSSCGATTPDRRRRTRRRTPRPPPRGRRGETAWPPRRGARRRRS